MLFGFPLFPSSLCHDGGMLTTCEKRYLRRNGSPSVLRYWRVIEAASQQQHFGDEGTGGREQRGQWVSIAGERERGILGSSTMDRDYLPQKISVRPGDHHQGSCFPFRRASAGRTGLEALMRRTGFPRSPDSIDREPRSTSDTRRVNRGQQS